MTRKPPDAEVTKRFNAKVADEFRANNGNVSAFENNELLLLTTTGAKSGEQRLSPLSCKRIDGKLVVIGGYGGNQLAMKAYLIENHQGLIIGQRTGQRFDHVLVSGCVKHGT